METVQNAPLGGIDHVARILSRYPAVTAEEVSALEHWFNRDASALEVASLASREAIYEQYLAFRADHIDGFTVRDFIAVAVAVACAGAAVFYLTM